MLTIIYFILSRATRIRGGGSGALFCDSVSSVGKSGNRENGVVASVSSVASHSVSVSKKRQDCQS